MKPKLPVWQFYHEIRDGGKVKAQCKFCGVVYVTHADRMIRHLIVSCTKCPATLKSYLQKQVKASKNLKSVNINMEDAIKIENPGVAEFDDSTTPTPSTSSNVNNSDPKGKSIKKHPNQLTTQKEQETSFSRAVFSSPCPFSTFENTYWKDFLGQVGPSFQIPDRNKMFTTLLYKQYWAISKEVNEKIQNATTLTIQSDGWTNPQDTIHMTVHTEEARLFLKCITTTDKEPTYIAEELNKVIDEIGREKIVGLVTDSTDKNMQTAWKILQAKLPLLRCYGCVRHILERLLNDAAKLPKLVEPIRDFVTFFERRGTTACLSDVRKMMVDLKIHVEAEMASPPEQFTSNDEQAIRQTIDMACTSTHNAAYLLDPRFLGNGLTPLEMEDALNLIAKMSTMLEGDVKILGELINFKAKAGRFQSPVLWKSVKSITTPEMYSSKTSDVSPRVWWKSWFPASRLSEVAQKLLGLPPSSISVDRNRRNFTAEERTEKAVFVQQNLKLMAEAQRSEDLWSAVEDVKAEPGSDEEDRGEETIIGF